MRIPEVTHGTRQTCHRRVSRFRSRRQTKVLGLAAGKTVMFRGPWECRELQHRERRTADIILESGDKSVIIQYSAQVVTAPQEIREAFNVRKCFDYEFANRCSQYVSSNWAAGEQITTYLLSDDNPYAVAIDSDTVGARYQVRSTQQEIEVNINGDRVFEENAGITDMSMYSERTTSNASGPEHQIVYVSETVKNNQAVNYDNLTSCGLVFRSGREFNQVDQIRTWLYSGIEVKRFHPSEAGSVGPSNLLPDLVYYLMTDSTAGIGDLISNELLDLDSFARACQFLRTNELFFNGAITEPQNLRDYITEIAPFFLMDFAILGGKFSFQPVLLSRVTATSAQEPLRFQRCSPRGTSLKSLCC